MAEQKGGTLIMGQFVRCVKGEFLKMRHTPFYILHLILPLLGALLFLAYYRTSPWGFSGKLQAYLEVLSVLFPLLGAIMAAMAAEQETAAGGCQELLAVPWSRFCALGSKLVMLLMNALAASGVAVWVFYLGFAYILGEQQLGAGAYLIQWMIIFASQAGLYTFHLFLGLQWGKSVCIGMGLVETLLSALMLTGLGDGLWFFFPLSHAGHFSAYALLGALGNPAFPEAGEIGIAAAATIVLTAGVFIWFQKFQGQKPE